MSLELEPEVGFRRGQVIAVIALVAGVVVFRGGKEEPPAASSSRPPPIESLLRDGTKVATVIFADLGGDGIEDIILHSESETQGDFGPPQNFVDVFEWHRSGGWSQVFDATTFTPSLEPEAPPLIQPAPEPDAVVQQVSFLDTVDFFGDDGSELVLGVQIAGASEGPLNLSVLSFDAEGPATIERGDVRELFQYRTQSGGTVTAEFDHVRLETGMYRPIDAHCCPSATLRLEIGARRGEIGILEQSVLPNAG